MPKREIWQVTAKVRHGECDATARIDWCLAGETADDVRNQAAAKIADDGHSVEGVINVRPINVSPIPPD
ncbi:hypothetical protein OG747_36635 [Streptomyces sp. NBC_01384]|uniref:hypothetical protein n=1 Tax=Streptomyces sp. NBC_01384 TaxID=2903847 RepID=UPI003249CA82